MKTSVFFAALILAALTACPVQFMFGIGLHESAPEKRIGVLYQGHRVFFSLCFFAEPEFSGAAYIRASFHQPL